MEGCYGKKGEGAQVKEIERQGDGETYVAEKKTINTGSRLVRTSTYVRRHDRPEEEVKIRRQLHQ